MTTVNEEAERLMYDLDTIASEFDYTSFGLPIYRNDVSDKMRERIEEYTRQVIQRERILSMSIVKKYHASFDDDWYVCLPPQDVIGDLIRLLKRNEEQ